ncbi:MAG: hypothetical protein WC455_31400 [Dehalococcoidia bacterium]|jgi:hypothetical protein
MGKDLSDFGVCECEGGACEVNFSRPVDPEWEEFDAKVAERKAKLDAVRQSGEFGGRLPERLGIKDLIALTPYEEEAINSILSCVDPDDIFGLLEDLNSRDRITFIAGFVVGRSI